jgi:uncharacterized damage-inducible protein DinB
MLIETLKLLFKRDLEKLKTEIEKYQNDENLWRIEKSIANSAGNLCLHLIGNLNTYIGAEFGKTNYIRRRNLEFSLKNIPKTELLQQIDNTIKVVELSLDKLTDAEIKEEYPLLVFEKKTTTEFMLVHLTTHLSYHLGQINYHRRLLDNQ